MTSSKKVSSLEFPKPQAYTPKHLADKILTARSSIEGERKVLTVLFADVANYTAMAEKLDPEEVHQIMDGCFNILLHEIHAYEGTINQFTGDGIMAIFGAPVAHEDHAQRACWSALAIQKALGNYNKKLRQELGIDFKMRIGINSGPVVVGSIGDDLRMDYTAVGDTTNLAARIVKDPDLTLGFVYDVDPSKTKDLPERLKLHSLSRIYEKSVDLVVELSSAAAVKLINMRVT